MSPRSVDALLPAFLLLFAAGAAGFAAGVPAASTTVSASSVGTSAALAPHNDTLSPPEQVIRVELRPRGNARWHVSVRIPLETRNDTAAFRDLASRFGAGNSDALTPDTFEEAATRAGDESGRTMRIRDVNRSRRIENGTGVLGLSFTWTNFAETSGDRLVVGDAFNTSAGTWLPYLTERQTLLLAPPEGYGVRSSPPVAVENGVARWEGPVEFSGREPWIVYAGDVETSRTPTTAGPVTSTTDPGLDDSSSLLLLAAAVGGGLVLVVAYLVRRGHALPGAGTAHDPGAGSGGAGSPAADDAAGAPDGTATPDASGTGNPESGGAAEGAGDSGGAVGSGAAATDGESDEEIDVTLLSDEERVERLLERNGGRMKQASIVKETGWSNAKVSQLLSSMEEEGRIDKLRIGRENLISFPEEDITDLDSE
jgi:hypothetical protein